MNRWVNLIRQKWVAAVLVIVLFNLMISLYSLFDKESYLYKLIFTSHPVQKGDVIVGEKTAKKPVTEILIDVPVLSQLPELDRGCEVTSLAMLLRHAGIQADKMILAKQIKKDPTRFSRVNGITYFGNPNDGFVGDIYTFAKSGLGVYHKPVAALAETYLPGRVLDLSGESFDNVIKQLAKGKPVWVITNSTYKYLADSHWRTWHTPTGKIKVTYYEHCVLLTGFDAQYVYFNDPLTSGKNIKVSKTNFIEAWEQIGSQAISYN
jgi:uncharacterized protein YvpB